MAPSTIRTRSFVEYMCSVQPYYALLAGLIPGFGLIFGSILFHVSDVIATAPAYAKTTRQVGYLAALNWSLTYAVLLPILLYLMTNTLSGIADAMDRLQSCDMIRTPDLKPVTSSVLTEAWFTGSRARNWLTIAFAVVVPAGFGLIEWFLNNFLRLVQRSQANGVSDYDWGLAGIMHPPGQEIALSHRLANAAFDLVAFSTEILLLGSLIAFFIAILDLGRVVPTGKRTDIYVILPDLEADDKRLGFEVFEYPLENLLGASLVAYLICYFVRLQGAYMADSSAANLADFVSKDIFQGITQASMSLSRKDLAPILIRLCNLGDQQVRGMLAWLMSVLLSVFSLIAVVMTVRASALTAELNARDAIRKKRLNLNSVQTKDAKRALDSMAIWPLGYLRLDFLIFWISMAVITLLLYRIGLFVAGAVVFVLLYRLLSGLMKSPSRRNAVLPSKRAQHEDQASTDDYGDDD